MLVAIALLRWGAAHAAASDPPKIAAIEVVGNDKTHTETVILLAGLRVGGPVDASSLAEAQEALISSELFSDVQITAAPERPRLAGLTFDDSAQPGNDMRVTIAVKEKWSWVAGPTVFAQQGNVGLGLGFIESNLLGRDKKLLLYGQYATGDTFFFGTFFDPAVSGSRFYARVDVYLRHLDIKEYVTHSDDASAIPQLERQSTFDYLDGAFLLGAKLGRGWASDLRVRGAKVAFGAAHMPDTDVPLPPPGDDGWDFSAELRLKQDLRKHHYGVTTGTFVQLYFEQAIPGLSDFTYSDGHVRTMLAARLFGEHNLVFKGYAALGWQLPFQQEFSGGGANSLRGYVTNEFRGNLQLKGSLEYSVPLFRAGALSFRGLGFWDTGFTSFVGADDTPWRHYLPDQTVSRLNQWRNGVGGGFRIYFRSVVLPLLGVDVGYGIEARDFHFYFAAGLLEL